LRGMATQSSLAVLIDRSYAVDVPSRSATGVVDLTMLLSAARQRSQTA